VHARHRTGALPVHTLHKVPHFQRLASLVPDSFASHEPLPAEQCPFPINCTNSLLPVFRAWPTPTVRHVNANWFFSDRKSVFYRSGGCRMPLLTGGTASSEGTNNSTPGTPRHAVTIRADVAAIKSVLDASVGILAPLGTSCPCFGLPRRSGGLPPGDEHALAPVEAPEVDDSLKKLWKDSTMPARKRRFQRTSWDDTISITFCPASSLKVTPLLLFGVGRSPSGCACFGTPVPFGSFRFLCRDYFGVEL
jgi:hypothetical protein